MRYHIDTIPVWDSIKVGGECFLCALERKNELDEAERYLGASVMEPDIRIQVNEKGFCRRHHAMLYDIGNRLGHALMMESHTARTRERLEKLYEPLKKSARQCADSPLGGMTRKGRAAREELNRLAAQVADIAGSCILCDSLAENMQRYYHTFFHLYQHDREFKDRFRASQGLCLPHTATLLRMAPEELPAGELPAFVDLVCDLERQNLDRIQEDVSWFIKKFDYRYDNEPWKNSRDAVPRDINKLRGWCVGDEPWPKE